MRLRLLTLGLAAVATPALADQLVINKSVVIVSDPLGSVAPKSLPGAIADYTINLSNPATNTGLPVRNMVFEDQIPANVMLRVSDLGTGGSGPIVFTDGVAVLGVGNSGLTYTFGGLANTSDSLEFSNGVSWGYVPVPDSDGFDANVRAIRVKPITTFKTSGSFALRFRVKIR